MAAYTELHLHTSYSFLEGASQPEETVRRAVGLGYQAIAITDHDGLHGAMEFAQKCKEIGGIRPVTGVELTLRHGLVDVAMQRVHLTLLAETGQGYANLCRLITQSYCSNPADDVALDPTFLSGHTDGIIALTGCRTGELAQLIDAERWQDASHLSQALVALFGQSNVFVELQQNLVHGDTTRIRHMVALAKENGLPIVATGNVHYHIQDRHRLQDALVALKHHQTLEASHAVRRPNSEFYLHTPDDMAALFSEYPQAIANTQVISERCASFNLAEQGAISYEFPDFRRSPEEQTVTADQALADYCQERFAFRYAPDKVEPWLLEEAKNRLQQELRLVSKHRMAGFFLIYRNIQELATQVAQEVRGAGTARGGSGLPPGRGRGSAVSSIICYLLGLSHVDPVKNKLFIHRFLNEDMQTYPDIDLDFARDIREQLILRVLKEYGQEHAALVCSFATYKFRSAVRDLGKVLGLPEDMLDKLAKLGEGGSASTVRLELDRLPGFAGQTNGPIWQYLVELATQIDGFPRHVSQHVGGMIISSQPLVESVPVQPAAMPGRFICQWDKDSCDDAKFIKIDFLALGMLSLVEECTEQIWQNRGEKLDFSAINYQEGEIYDAICEGDTVGLFQIESRAQIQMLTRTQPRTLDDLAVQVAIVRPGPIVGGAVNPYVQRKERKRQEPDYLPLADDPLLQQMLGDTLGVILYQDQVLEVTILMGGFSPARADAFRRAMSRRRSNEEMGKFRDEFIEGARAKNVRPSKAEDIFRKLMGFSAFGFPKSHAYAFAFLAYQSAWLRRHYPAEYYAALFNNQPMGFYTVDVIQGDAKRHEVPILRPSINSSSTKCISKGDKVLLGLSFVQGVSEALANAIVAERATGPYAGLSDLLRRANIPYQAAVNLISIGALSEFGMGRRELMWQLGLLLPQIKGMGASIGYAVAPKRRTSSQLALDIPTEQDMVPLADMSSWDRMLQDYQLMSFSPSTHPMALLRPRLAGKILTHQQLKEAPPGTRASTAGMVVVRQRPGTAKGFVFLLVEDETGLTNVVVRPKLYDEQRAIVRGAAYVLVEGTIENKSGSLNLIANTIVPLPEATDSPEPPLRSPYPGNPEDPREKPVEQLLRATPDSHNFH